MQGPPRQDAGVVARRSRSFFKQVIVPEKNDRLITSGPKVRLHTSLGQRPRYRFTIIPGLKARRIRPVVPGLSILVSFAHELA